MTVYYLNTSLYRDLLARFFPKMENRDYCGLLKKSLEECEQHNGKTHAPCNEIKLFIKKIDCYSLEPRPLVNVNEHQFTKIKT